MVLASTIAKCISVKIVCQYIFVSKDTEFQKICSITLTGRVVRRLMTFQVFRQIYGLGATKPIDTLLYHVNMWFPCMKAYFELQILGKEACALKPLLWLQITVIYSPFHKIFKTLRYFFLKKSEKITNFGNLFLQN